VKSLRANREDVLAQLDPLLEALLDRNAEELVLAADDKPSFRFGADLKPVSQRVLNQAQITVLLSELADEVEAQSLAAGRTTRFVYRLADGRPFECLVTGSDGGFGATLRPGAGDPVPVGLPVSQPAPEIEGQQPPSPAVAEPPAAVVATTPAAAPVAAPAPVRPATPGGAAAEIEAYLHRMVELGASDLHLSAHEVPMIRLHGDMIKLEGTTELTPEKTRELLHAIMPERNRGEFEKTHDTDFAHEIQGLARFRVNAFEDRKGVGGVMRVIPTDILTAEQLGLPPAILQLCHLSKGLVVVTGPTGSGKSTTLAAMVDYINSTRNDHIITIEDPIEFVHPNRTCLINQREVATHTRGFKPALRAALREDPDIVLVGEMRDLETIAIAIETAETGHLVFGTLHTTTACSTVDRIIDQFPADRQAQIRTMLSESLRGVVAQTLLKKVEGGRVAALEVLIVTPAIANLIREGKTFQIPSMMQTGRAIGMQLLNDSLVSLVKSKTVSPDEAYLKAVDKTSLVGQLRNAGFKVATGTDS